MQYMRQTCPEVFPADLVGPLPSWPTDQQKNLLPDCDSSSAMAACIDSVAGAVGYIGLDEARLPKDDATDFWTSQEAAASGGIRQAQIDILPEAASADFGAVTLVNRPNGAWSMVLLTYIYVRQDLSFMETADERGLLIAFLRALYDENYMTVCEVDYGFKLPSEAIRAFGINAVDQLETAAGNSTKWIFEGSDTQPIVGQGKYVLSSKRDSVTDLDRDAARKAIANLETMLTKALSDLSLLENNLTAKDAAVDELRSIIASLQSGGSGNTELQLSGDNESKLRAALSMSSLCFIALIVLGLYAVCRFVVVNKP
jgi:hypothetical protein